MRLLDAHCHDHDLEPADWRRVRPTLDAIGWAGAVVNGAYPADWPLVRAFADRETGGGVKIVKAYGVHPWHLDKIDAGDDWLRQLRQRLDAEPEATIGEIGIDRGRCESEWERAERVFLAQVDEAALRDRVMTVHCVKAHDRLWELLRRRGLPRRGWLLHGWSGPAHLVAKFASLGACFSFSACTLTRRKPRASLPLVPPDRVLMETDAPYMTPPPEPPDARRCELTDASGQPINHPANLATAYDTAAQLLNTPVDALATQIAANFDGLFGD